MEDKISEGKISEGKISEDKTSGGKISEGKIFSSQQPYPAATGNLHSTPTPGQPLIPRNISYLGPSGTFTEQALFTQPDLALAEHHLASSIADALLKANRGETQMAFVPIENSIEGSVNVTLDVLAFESEIFIQREVVIAVQLHLLAQPGAELDNIVEVLSHPQALGQCREFIQEHLPDAKLTIANSTAEAAELIAQSNDMTKAAIGTQLAGKIHGLTRLVEHVEDHYRNQTRFVAVAKDHVPLPTGNDKTSLVVFQRENKPGSLLGILEEFSAQALDLTKLQSRPMKQILGEYCFVIDFLGHIAEAHVAKCLLNIDAHHGDVKFLGSYPTAEVG